MENGDTFHVSRRVMSLKVIRDQYVVLPKEVQRAKDRLNDTHSPKATVHVKPNAVGTAEADPQRGEEPHSETPLDDTHLHLE
jgi:hypothetical protein